MADKVLFVDDEQGLLDSFRRILRKKVPIDTANSGKEALRMMEEADPPYAVIVCDQNMPGMSGTAVLAEVRERWPETVRLMLTGQADLTTAVEAVNEGQIFRFLTKPIPSENLLKSLEAAIHQYQLITAEKELLGQTLRGSVRVLTEMLSLTSPIASGKTSRIQRYVNHMVKTLKLEDDWKYDLAAMLSQLGCITLPLQIVDKVFSGEKLSPEEDELFQQHPVVAKKLIAHIPRLQHVAYMIASQLKDYQDFPEAKRSMAFVTGSQLIRAANDFDTLLLRGMKPYEAIAYMRKQEGAYNTEVLDALEAVPVERTNLRMRSVGVGELHTRMVFNQNVTARNGLVLVSKGKEVTFTVIEMLRSFKDGIGVNEPIRVMEYQ